MLEENYIINQHMMCMVGFYDRNGKTCTLVREVDKTFIVDKSPLEILEFSIKSIGFSLKGAMKTAKWYLGDIHMYPVMVNPILKICLFPNHSPKRVDTMWFNPDQIHRTTSSFLKTNVEFKNGFTMRVHSKLSAFNTKLQIAEQYQKMTVEAAKNPVTFLLDPKNRKVLLHHLLVFSTLTEIIQMIS